MEKTLKRSATPKYASGTMPVPIEPINIMESATAAHIPRPLQPSFFAHPMMIRTSEEIEVITTPAVTT